MTNPNHLITLLRQRRHAARVKRMAALGFSLVTPVVIILTLLLTKL